MKILLFLSICFIGIVRTQAQCTQQSIYANDSVNASCTVIDDKVKTIYTNNLPKHPYGTWTSNNPVTAQDFTFYMCAHPQKASEPTSIYDAGNFSGGCSQYVEFGLSIDGIRMAPYGARWFVNPTTNEENRDWNLEALVLFKMDFNNSHSTQAGQYHYHGIPTRYFNDSLKIDGTKHSPIVGYAADGFPIYYKYVFEESDKANSAIVPLTSGHTLKAGTRPGDGVTAPNGAYDGLYIEDYEYTKNNWPLDECNGRFGVTPEFPQGTYYYVLTDNWPYIPRCFYGNVIDNTFRIGPRCPASTAATDCQEAVVNTSEVANEISVLIKPNPSSYTIQIAGLTEELKAQIEQLSIYDLKGKIWFTRFNFVQNIDVHAFPKGSYFLQLRTSNTSVTKKIVVQ